MTTPNSRYAHLTSPQAKAAKEASDLLILPVGALEQHGDGLPLGTDTIRADYVADRVAANLGGRAHALPAVPYGVSPHHRNLPGTVSIPPVMFAQLIVQIAAELADAGWPKLLVVTGHGGNCAALGVAQQELLATHPHLTFAWTPVSALAASANAALAKTEVSGHSGESETAQVLAIAPELVQRDQLHPGARKLDDLDARARLSRTAKPTLAVTFDEYAANGVLGDPTTVTPAEGAAILDEVVEKLTAYAEQLLAL